MFTIALSHKAEKLVLLLELEGFTSLEDFILKFLEEGTCSGICMTEGCGHRTKVEPDLSEGFCEACSGNTIVSGFVLVGFI
ncbi:hypothetical protein [Bradyrhizobium zhanjiangense]|uniref:Uncharacterized protein n=1 Tax=Bradyrhizobium zhanjiangense TaxID=1325107 RepID=A0A4Q0Q460_9BRAD|nr:hypothetical protein [Bradyrhizobium zhanjiangense]RXG83615.1 hypothetical protein EAS61_41680 [Bradyrhizobium zhanjiangense]